MIIFTKDSQADLAFFRDVLQLPNIDVGDGWLIFKLPPSELAVHPADQYRHELFLTCEDIYLFVDQMSKAKISCSPVQEKSWGLLTELTMPGGGKLGIYQPKHKSPHDHVNADD